MAVAFVLDQITLHEGKTDGEFETFMLEEIFPAIDTSSDEQQTILAHRQFLLKGQGPNEYLWVSQLEYFFHQTPFPGWLSNRVERIHQETPAKLAEFGTRTSSAVYYDVASL